MLRELQNIILLRDWRKPTSRAEWSVGILGGVIALIGIILALGGVKLISVDGSWYYLFAGLALIVAGLSIGQHKLLGRLGLCRRFRGDCTLGILGSRP